MSEERVSSLSLTPRGAGTKSLPHRVSIFIFLKLGPLASPTHLDPFSSRIL